MSISPLEAPHVYQAVKKAGVLERGHAVLNSGRHTMVKVFLDRIIDNAKALQLMYEKVADSAGQLEVDAIVPVPTGATRILEANYYPWQPFRLSPRKLGAREFEFADRDRGLLQSLGRVAIFEDVVTTGATPAALADEITAINPDVEIHLISGWLRGKIEPQFASKFTTQTHIISRRIQDWAPEDCPHHLPGGAA